MLAALSCFAAAGPAQGYQSDLHYGLTYWLAKEAGFSVRHSHDIARSNEMTDIGDLDAMHAMIARVCTSLDTAVAEQSSRIARDHHFRSAGDVPGEPKDRPVDHRVPFASFEVEAAIASAAIPAAEKPLRLGRALHGWQDAFSHAGIPDTSKLCPRPQYFWSHPRERGGAYSTEADLTPVGAKSIELCLAAAESSHGFVVRLRKALVPDAAPPAWAALRQRATGFCAARTKTEKARWFADQGVPQADAIVARTSLPDGTRPFIVNRSLNLLALPSDAPPEPTEVPYYASPQRDSDPRVRDPRLAAVAEPPAGAAAPDSAASRWLGAFLRGWLTATPQTMPEVVRRFVDPAFAGGASKEEVLWRWRLLDRGMAETAPTVAPPTARDQAFFASAGDNWPLLLVPVRGRPQQPWLVFEASDARGKGLAAHVILRHAPYHVMFMRAVRVGEDFRLTEFNGLPVH